MYIAICGPSGAGKDTAADMLAIELGIPHVSGGDVLREMLSTLGLEPKKSAIGPFGVFIRENYGLQPIFERVVARAKDERGLIVSGARSPDEAKLIQSYGGKVVYIDADAETRYARIIQRSRQSDVASLKEFRSIDQREHTGVAGHEQNLDSIKALSDVVIMNNGTTEELLAKLRAELRLK